MPRTRRTFTDAFKREAVKRVKQPGAKVSHIARDLGIEQSVLRRWVDQEHGGVLDMRPSKPLRSEAASEVERLQRELRRVTTERDILKKRSATSPRTHSEIRIRMVRPSERSQIRTRSGWPTSPTSGPLRAGCTQRP